jgi:ABC-type transport system involved in cytochrome c biogenesis permease subunit
VKIIEGSLAVTCALFLASGLLAALYLVSAKTKFERWSFTSVRAGLPILTLHLLLRSIHDYRFGGSAWSWEPRQIALWMLWVYFAMNLHLPRPGRKTVMATCLGSLLVMFALLNSFQR